MFKRYPILTRFILLVLLPLIMMAGYILFKVAKSAPVYEGTIMVSGLNDDVKVTFNHKGSPQVVAQTDSDAFFAQGYLHASERLWQMELQRRLIYGRSAEIFGQAGLATDQWMRTLDLEAAAQQSWQNMPSHAKQVLESYTKGVNAYIAELEVLPAEFLFLDVQPTPWLVTDSVAWQKVFALNLGLNMYQELNRLAALRMMSVEQLRTFYPSDPDYRSSPLFDSQYHHLANSQAKPQVKPSQGVEQVMKTARLIEQQWAIGGKNVGSNAWVVAGKHTQSGSPIIANDPHLSIQTPSSWYAISLQGDALNVQGMSLVGLPGVILGSNKDISWAATSLMADQQDIFILDVPLGQNDKYLTDGGLQPIDCQRQQIVISQEKPAVMHNKISPVEIEVCRTTIGPVISRSVAGQGHDLVLKWSALDSVDDSLAAFIDLQYASNHNDFRQALRQLKNPAMHFLYADQQGNIASQVAGSIPRRGSGVGVLPTPAFKSAYQWQGYVDFDQLPQQFNPSKGYLIAANNRVESDVVISHEWASDARKVRIGQLIEQHIKRGIKEGNKLNLDDTLMMQLDHIDVGAKRLAQLLTDDSLSERIIAQTPEADKPWIAQGLTTMKSWQGQYSKQSVAASIYFYWLMEIKNGLFASLKKSGGAQAGFLVDSLIEQVDERQLLSLLQNRDNVWCKAQDDALIGCEPVVVSGFIQAMKALKKDTGKHQIEDWAWGELHHVTYQHKVFGNVKGLELIYQTRRSVGGSQNSVNVANAIKDPEGGWGQSFGAAFRTGVDLADLSQAYFVFPGGQSGHVMSRHFDTMIDAFNEAEKFHFGDHQAPDSSSILNLQVKIKESH